MSNDYEQLSLWGEIYPHYKIQEPVILIEAFAGIGSQRKALELCGIKIDDKKSKIIEWAVPSIIGYNAIHIKDKSDYSKGMTKEELIEKLNGISTNYNDPLTLQQLKKKPIEWLANVYNNNVATHNLINIMNVKGKDLGFFPKNQTSILTYSFPCQDLSLAGKRQGMETSQKDGGTRSGLLWEVERILNELYLESREREESNLPHILLMENVPEVVGTNNIAYFKKWEERLRQFGYSNYVEILNGKDFGIPQNRRRCFMISILGEYAYDFPSKLKLKHQLRDLLESKVDEHYYLSNQDIERISHWKSQVKPLDNAIDLDSGNKLSPTITARGAGEDHSGMILVKSELFEDREIIDFDSSDAFRREHNNYEAPSIVCHSKFGVVEINDAKGEIKKIGNYRNGHHAKDVFDTKGIAPTITTGNHGLGVAIMVEDGNNKNGK